MTLQETKNNLLNLRAERDQRQADVQVAHQRIAALSELASRLRAEQELDGVDHGKRLASIQAEIGHLEASRAAWADVDAELGRRVAAAEVAHAAALELDRQQTLAAMEAREGKLRKQFADKALALLEVSYQIQDLHDRRTAMRVAMLDEKNGGARTTLAQAPVNPERPPFFPGWLFHRQHLAEALRTLRNV